MQKPAILLHMSVDLKSLVDGLVHAARARPVPPSGGAVGTLQQLVADDLTAINSLIVERIFSEVRLLHGRHCEFVLPAPRWALSLTLHNTSLRRVANDCVPS